MKWVSQTKHAIESVVLFAKIQTPSLNGLYKVNRGLHVPVSSVLWSRGGHQDVWGDSEQQQVFCWTRFKTEVSHSTATTLWLLLESPHTLTATFTHWEIQVLWGEKLSHCKIMLFLCRVFDLFLVQTSKSS